MYGRLLRFLFALPVALVVPAGPGFADAPPQDESRRLAGEAVLPAPAAQPYNDRDAPPRVRIPPQYPRKCLARAKSKEVVAVEFDVAPEGRVVNASVVDSTNACFNKAALASVSGWEYRPATDENGDPRWRRGVQTVITFELM